MRQTPLPLLRDLRCGVVIRKCEYCERMVRMMEECESADEAKQCPPRELVEGKGT